MVFAEPEGQERELLLIQISLSFVSLDDLKAFTSTKFAFYHQYIESSLSDVFSTLHCILRSDIEP